LVFFGPLDAASTFLEGGTMGEIEIVLVKGLMGKEGIVLVMGFSLARLF